MPSGDLELHGRWVQYPLVHASGLAPATLDLVLGRVQEFVLLEIGALLPNDPLTFLYEFSEFLLGQRAQIGFG